MGQYFMWLNPVKRQYIEGYDFGHGGKRRESSYVGCPVLDALYTLMANEWKDDPIVWIGDDYATLSHETNSTLKVVEELCGRSPYDKAVEEYVDVAALFESSDKKWISETEPNAATIEFYKLNPEEAEELIVTDIFDYLDIDGEINYKLMKADWNKYLNCLINKGFFRRKPTIYRYIINHSKKEYIDRETIIPTASGLRYDPFPALMIKEDNTEDPVELPENNYCGTWLGDSIEVSNDISLITENYEDASNKYTWENGY